jgi:hypothetical protein
MPDPQKDIAPIIEPVAPPMPPAGPDYALPVVLIVGGLLLIAILVWRWRRHAPLRKLNKLADASDTLEAANDLAALIGDVQRVSPPAEWQHELERLRFGPPAGDASETLARLCRQAETFLRAR